MADLTGAPAFAKATADRQGADWAETAAGKALAGIDVPDDVWASLVSTIAAALREAERRGAERAAGALERVGVVMSAEQLIGYAKRPAGAPEIDK